MVNAGLIGAGFFAVALGLVWGAYLVSEQKHGRLVFKLFSVKADTVSHLPFAFVSFGVAFIILGWATS